MTLAHAAGAALADMEMIQFHPTALASGGERDGFLITEAVRGEGALLYDGAGERFVDELAPRDEVALAVQRKLDAGDRVELDMTMVQRGRFPNVVNTLNEVGIDPYRERIPVAPAAHYTMGGIATDLDGGSSLRGLYAVGECACNGLHGANRLASNSLAECFVFGRRAALAGPGRAGAAARPGCAAGRGAEPRAAARDARGAVAAGGNRARGGAAARAARRPVPARAHRRRIGARARGEPGRAPALGLPARRTRASTACTPSREATACRGSNAGTSG